MVTVEGAKVVFTPPENIREISVAALEPTSRIKQLGRANQIRRILKAKLPRREIDGNVSVGADDSNSIELRTVAVSSNDGWLYVEMQ